MDSFCCCFFLLGGLTGVEFESAGVDPSPGVVVTEVVVEVVAEVVVEVVVFSEFAFAFVFEEEEDEEEGEKVDIKGAAGSIVFEAAVVVVEVEVESVVVLLLLLSLFGMIVELLEVASATTCLSDDSDNFVSSLTESAASGFPLSK